MRGRPPTYKTAKEMEAVIERYFEECEGEVLRDKETGKVIYDKYGLPVIINRKPPTITGLALALGFTSRQALLNYQGKEKFVDTVTRAKLVVEEYAERRLYDRDGVNGAKFNLINNFKGWSEKPALEIDVENIARIAEILGSVKSAI